MPAYVKYKLFDLPVHRSVGREQERHIYWNDIHVVLAGMYGTKPVGMSGEYIYLLYFD